MPLGVSSCPSYCMSAVARYNVSTSPSCCCIKPRYVAKSRSVTGRSPSSRLWSGIASDIAGINPDTSSEVGSLSITQNTASARDTNVTPACVARISIWPKLPESLILVISGFLAKILASSQKVTLAPPGIASASSASSPSPGITILAVILNLTVESGVPPAWTKL